MDRFNIEKALITTTNTRAKAKDIAKVVKNETESLSDEKKLEKMFERLKKIVSGGQLNHQDVLSISEKAPERFYKMFWFNPKMSPDEEEHDYKILEEHFNKGFCGVKLHSGIHLIKIPEDINKLASFMQDYNPDHILYIHSTPKTPYFSGISTQDIARLAKSFPGLRILVGHAGFCMEYAINVGLILQKYGNLFFETSLSVSYALLSLIKAVGHKRILFGSDAPITSPIQIEIDKILTLPISNEQKQDIFYYNLENLLEI